MSNDLISILGNLSRSLYPIQKLVSGGAYIIAILFLVIAIHKLLKIADRHAQPSHEKGYVSLIYFAMALFLFYMPSVITFMANTAFGANNVIAYTHYNSADIYSIIGLMMRTAGVVWFVRGCVLIARSSDPNIKHGTKGLLFLIAGVFAINFDNCIAVFNYIVDSLVSWNPSFKVL